MTLSTSVKEIYIDFCCYCCFYFDQQVKNPQRDLPLGIGAALSICCFLYMMVAVVIVGIVPYFAMDPDTPISSAFAKHGMKWAM